MHASTIDVSASVTNVSVAVAGMSAAAVDVSAATVDLSPVGYFKRSLIYKGCSNQFMSTSTKQGKR